MRLSMTTTLDFKPVTFLAESSFLLIAASKEGSSRNKIGVTHNNLKKSTLGLKSCTPTQSYTGRPI